MPVDVRVAVDGAVLVGVSYRNEMLVGSDSVEPVDRNVNGTRTVSPMSRVEGVKPMVTVMCV